MKLHSIRSSLLVLLSTAALFLSGSTIAQNSTPGFDEETASIAEALGLVEGLTVADVGAGDGRYSAFLAEVVGSTGRVYATEIDQEKVDAITRTVAGSDHVSVILGKHNSTELPQQCCDRILLRRVFHHLHHPDSMLKSLYDSLKPGGTILIVDFLPRHDIVNLDATPHDHEHGISVDKLIHAVRHNGFELVRQLDNWPSRVIDGKAVDYAVLFRRL